MSLSKLDAPQVLQSVYDDDGALRVTNKDGEPIAVSGSLSIGAESLRVVDYSDVNPLPASALNPASGALVQIIATAAASAKFARISDTTGYPVAFHVNGAVTASFISSAGMDDQIQVKVDAGNSVSARYLENVSPTAGTLIIQLIG
jgi:hypothetical protein